MARKRFLEELKRRHVYRVAAAYVVVGWLLIQVATQVFPIFHLPDWIDQAVVLLILIGFPIALVLAWAFDATPRGVVATDAAAEDGNASVPVRNRSRRAGIAVGLIGVLIAVIAGAAYWHFGRTGSRAMPVKAAANAHPTRSPDGVKRNPGNATPDSAAGGAASGLQTAAQPIPAKSIAVLPFENLSTDKGNAYFADGMQDLILTKLADIGDLKVISRTSTLQYGSHPEDLKQIGQQLGVATILEGSVQKAGNQVLINVQLIDAKTDGHIWAQSYERTLDNIFGVEGEVAGKVATALKAKLTPVESARVANVPTTNTAAYNAFMQGEYYAQRGLENFSKADLLSAFERYRQAVSDDPKFALAWAQMAYWQLVYLHFFGNDQPGLVASIKASIDRAFALQPHLEQAYLAKGAYLYYVKSDPAEAAKAFAIAHQLKPQDATAIFASGLALESLGKRDAAIDAYKKASALDPRQTASWLNVSYVYLTERRYTDAEHGLKRALAIDPASVFAVAGLTQLYSLTGNLDAMQSLLNGAPASVKASPTFKPALAQYFIYRRRWVDARTTLLEEQAAGQPDWNTECMLGDVEELAGNSAKARQYFQRCFDLLPEAIRHSTDSGAEPGNLGLALVRLGRTREALAQGQRGIETLPPTSPQEQNAILLMAQIQAQAGMAKEAVESLDRLFSMPASGAVVSVPLLRMDPDWDSIRDDPRFQTLLKKYPQPAAASTSIAEAANPPT